MEPLTSRVLVSLWFSQLCNFTRKQQRFRCNVEVTFEDLLMVSLLQERKLITVLFEMLNPGHQEEGGREEHALKTWDTQVNGSTPSQPVIMEKAKALTAQGTEYWTFRSGEMQAKEKAPGTGRPDRNG